MSKENTNKRDIYGKVLIAKILIESLLFVGIETKNEKKTTVNSENQILQYGFTLYVCYRSAALTHELDSKNKTCNFGLCSTGYKLRLQGQECKQ